MRIRQLIDISGSIDGQQWPGRGECIDVPDQVGADMIANGYAEEAKAAAKNERATADPVQETAASPKTRQRRGPADKD